MAILYIFYAEYENISSIFYFLALIKKKFDTNPLRSN